MDDTNGFAESLAQARAGNRSVLDRLLQQVHHRLVDAAHGLMGTPLRAKLNTSDLVQSTLLEGVLNLDAFRGSSEAEFAGWLHRILENNLRDRERYFRASRRDRQRETPLSDLHALATNDTASPSDEAAANEFLLRVSSALERIRPEYRRILLLCVTRDFTHAEAARILGKSPAASRVLLARARASLLAQLERDDRDRERTRP